MNRDTHVPADADAPVATLYAGQWLTLKQRGHWELKWGRTAHAPRAVALK